MSEVDRTFAALADPNRRRVVELLRKGALRAGALADALELSPPAMSRHLRVLRQSGLIEEQHDGADARVRMYRLRHRPFTEMKQWVEEVERFWAAELAAFAEHAERTRGKGKR
jgi:DNA-binding transcriptional ArsR family regulator